MRIEELQFGAMMTTALLTLTLASQIPQRVSSTVNRARWLMVAAMVLLFVQFFVQYRFGFRAMGITQAVAVNLVFFTPCSCLLAVAVLLLQRRGTVPRSAWAVGLTCWTLTILLLGGAAAMTGLPVLSDTAELRTAEYMAALLYAIAQTWYYYLHYKAYRQLRRTMANYYDEDADELLQWMHFSVLMLSVAAVFVPFAIFWSNYMLKIYALLLFGAIYYCIIRFYRYAVGTTPAIVEEAGETEEEEHGAKTPEATEDLMRMMEEKVKHWVDEKGFRRKKATIRRVAEEMGVSRNQLSEWLKTKGWLFNPWINSLRIEDAKKVMAEHPEWNNEAVALYCGFCDRTYFQTVFKEREGVTPTQFQQAAAGLLAGTAQNL